MMNSVSIQIQRAMNGAISSQVLPQIQNAIIAGSGQKGWNVPAEGPETNTKVLRNEKVRNNSKCELVQNRLSDGPGDSAFDTFVCQFSTCSISQVVAKRRQLIERVTLGIANFFSTFSSGK